MKKIRILSYIFFYMIALTPSGTLISFLIGCTFELVNYKVMAVISAIVSVTLVVMSCLLKEKIDTKELCIIYALSAPISLVNTLIYAFKCCEILVFVCMYICIGCCIYMAIRYGKPAALRVTSIVLSFLMLLPVCLCCLLLAFATTVVETTVIRTIDSPNGMHYAQIVDIDQGATGGNTAVDVYSKIEYNAIIFTISKKPNRIYLGEWGEDDDMKIYWKDNDTVVINSRRYYI